jgi:hypothetical protein
LQVQDLQRFFVGGNFSLASHSGLLSLHDRVQMADSEPVMGRETQGFHGATMAEARHGSTVAVA